MFNKGQTVTVSLDFGFNDDRAEQAEFIGYEPNGDFALVRWHNSEDRSIVHISRVHP